MAVAHQPPLIDHQPLHSHRTPGMDLVGADAHLGPQAKPETVAETAAAIQHHIRRIDQMHEETPPAVSPGDDDIGMSGTVTVDVVDGLRQGVDHFDGQDKIQVFGVPVCFCGRQDVDSLGGLFAASDFDPLRAARPPGTRQKTLGPQRV